MSSLPAQRFAEQKPSVYYYGALVYNDIGTLSDGTGKKEGIWRLSPQQASRFEQLILGWG